MQSAWAAQGFHASLELLPMWSGVDPDVELFASGKVLDDDGEWGGGHPLGTEGDAAGACVHCPTCLVALLLAWPFMHACMHRAGSLPPTSARLRPLMLGVMVQ